jgi:hypothetical protein
MPVKTIDEPKRKKIIRYLKTHSQQATAKHFDISSSTVNGIANSGTVKKTLPIRSEPKEATEAHKTYAKADRLGVLHKLMQKIDTSLDSDEFKTSDLRPIAIALGTAIDKFRLEEKETDEFGKEKAEVNAMFDMMRKGATGSAKST